MGGQPGYIILKYKNCKNHIEKDLVQTNILKQVKWVRWICIITLQIDWGSICMSDFQETTEGSRKYAALPVCWKHDTIKH